MSYQFVHSLRVCNGMLCSNTSVTSDSTAAPEVSFITVLMATSASMFCALGLSEVRRFPENAMPAKVASQLCKDLRLLDHSPRRACCIAQSDIMVHCGLDSK